MMTAGIDSGAGNTRAILLKDEEVIGRAEVRTGFDPVGALERSLEKAWKEAGVRREDIQAIGRTGSVVESSQAIGDRVDGIRAMSTGACFFFPDARTVVDVGAEEGRAARLDEQGHIVDSVVNERCAAGAGVFIETMSRVLEVPLEEMGPLALTSDRRIPMNAQCVIFAESEVIGLIHGGTPKADICGAIHDAMAGRIASMIRRIGVHPEVVMIGGVARNSGITEMMKRELKLKTLYIPRPPEYTAAVGAALVAAEEAG